MVAEQEYVRMHPAELVTRPPFSTLLPIRREVKEAIVHSMREKGEYDHAHPVIVWRPENVVIDGHTRLAAATEAGLDRISVYFHDFKDEYEAMEYAVACQCDRRNLTDQEIASLILAVDELKKMGGNRGNQYTGGKVATVENPTVATSDEKNRRSAEETAVKIGLATRYKVEQVRALKENDPESLEAVLEGKMTIPQAERSMRDSKKKKAEIALPAVTEYIAAHPDWEYSHLEYALEISRGVAYEAVRLLGLRKKDLKAATRPNGRPRRAGPSKPIAAVLNRASKASGLPSRRERDAESERYLAGFALRQIVGNYRLDDDAALYHAIGPLMAQIRDALVRSTGQRSVATMGPFYRMVHDLLAVPAPESWLACDGCTGRGVRDGTCRKCNGCGYLI